MKYCRDRAFKLTFSPVHKHKATLSFLYCRSLIRHSVYECVCKTKALTLAGLSVQHHAKYARPMWHDRWFNLLPFFIGSLWHARHYHAASMIELPLIRWHHADMVGNIMQIQQASVIFLRWMRNKRMNVKVIHTSFLFSILPSMSIFCSCQLVINNGEM